MDESKAEQIKDRHTAELMQLEGVNGVGLKKGEKGEPVIVLYLDAAADTSRLPKSVDGLTLAYEHSGRFKAF